MIGLVMNLQQRLFFSFCKNKSPFTGQKQGTLYRVWIKSYWEGQSLQTDRQTTRQTKDGWTNLTQYPCSLTIQYGGHKRALWVIHIKCSIKKGDNNSLQHQVNGSFIKLELCLQYITCIFQNYSLNLSRLSEVSSTSGTLSLC